MASNSSSLSNLWLPIVLITGRLEHGIVGCHPAGICIFDPAYLLNWAETGSIPAEIGNLTSLTKLYLDNNDLNGTIPSDIGSLTSLTDLQIHNNQLSGSIPPEIGCLIWIDLHWSNPARDRESRSQAKGQALPFTRGFHLIGQLVASFNPYDLDAMGIRKTKNPY